MSDAGTGAALRIEAPAPIRGIALVDSAARISALLGDMRIARWSCTDGRLLGEVTYRGTPPTAGAIAPGGDRLALATGDNKVRLLDASTLTPVAEMRPAASPRKQLSFSPDGTLLAGFAGGRRLELTIWKVATGAPLLSFTDPALEAAGIAFHPGGRIAAVSLLTGDVLLLDLASGRPTRTLSEAQMTSKALAFSPDGSALVVAAYDGALLVWETAHWGGRRFEGIPGANALAVSPDGARVVLSRSSYNPPDTPAEARLLELRTGRVLSRMPLGIVSTTAVAFLDPGRARVASARGTSLVLREIAG
jgi:WD40 repeat protein